MTRLAVFAMPTAIMPKRAIPIAAEVSVEPVSPSEAWPAKRDASEGMVQQRMRYMTEEQSSRNVCGMLNTVWYSMEKKSLQRRGVSLRQRSAPFVLYLPTYTLM